MEEGEQRGRAKRQLPRRSAALAHLVVVLSCGCARVGAAGRAGAAAPDFGVYHTVADMEREFSALAAMFPGVASVENVTDAEGLAVAAAGAPSSLWSQAETGAGVGALDRLPVLHLSNFSRPTAPDGTPKIRALFAFGEHGRELVSMEVALALARRAVGSRLQRFLAPGLETVFIDQLLHWTHIVLLPVVNPRSRRRVEGGAVCDRMTPSGVDPNRNWNASFVLREDAEQSSGPRPFSEPESRMARDVMRRLRPHLYINVHSGISELYMPWDCSKGTPPGPHGARLRRVLAAIARPQGWRTGGGADIGGYPACGTSMDWAFTHCGVPLSFTAEVFGGDGSPHDCYPFFNPTDARTLAATTSRWSAALFRAAALAVAEFRGVEIARGVPPLGPSPQGLVSGAPVGLAPPRHLTAALSCWAPGEACPPHLTALLPAADHVVCLSQRPGPSRGPRARVMLHVHATEEVASDWAATVASAAVLAVAVQAAAASGHEWRGPDECVGAALAAVQALAVMAGPGEVSLPQAARRVAPLVDVLSLAVGLSPLPLGGGSGQHLAFHVRAVASGNGSFDHARGDRGSSGVWVARERGGFAVQASGQLPADAPGCASPDAKPAPSRISFPSKHSDGRWRTPVACAWGGCACVGCDGRERCSPWAGSVPPRESLVRETAEAASRVLAGIAEALEKEKGARVGWGEDGEGIKDAEGTERRGAKGKARLRQRHWASDSGSLLQQEPGLPAHERSAVASGLDAAVPLAEQWGIDTIEPANLRAPAWDAAGLFQVVLLHSVALLVVCCIWRALRR